MARKLAAYEAKRDFSKTKEPRGSSRAVGHSFVIQKHAATRLHYDLRLELDGTLKSWAVTRGPSLVPGEKRLAVHVEDHPLDYASFEGNIPKGQYGGGQVIVWDRGTWTPEGDADKGLRKGHLKFELDGKKLRGGWHLVRLKPRPKERRENWLLIKAEDEAARAEAQSDILEELPASVLTDRTIEDVAREAGDEAPRRSSSRRAKAKSANAPVRKSRSARRRVELSFAEPALARVSSEAPDGAPWVHEIKFDGYRMQPHVSDGRVKLLTRKALDWTERFQPVANALQPLQVRTAILDGEIVVEGTDGISDFSALQAALREGRNDSFVCYLFDLLHLDGTDFRPLPLTARKQRLAELVAELPADGPIRLSEHFEESGPVMLAHACRLSFEGIVSKLKKAPYRSGRTGDWVKTKCAKRQEFVVGGYSPSSAVRNAIASLLLGFYDGDKLVYAGRVGTGYSREDARDLWKRLQTINRKTSPFAALPADERRKDARWAAPEFVVEVEFKTWTADNVLRHAAFKGLREDKAPREIVRETAPTPRSAVTTGVKFSHPDRVYWPDAGVTKQGLADFYAGIWTQIAPHIAGRPLALIRCPGGIEESCFFQKHTWAGLDDTIKVSHDPEDGEELLSIDDLDGLMGLVQAGVLEIHPWGSTLQNIERPERLIFDLDPGPGVTWLDVIAASAEVRERLARYKLASFVKTTGGKGLHVVTPLEPAADWERAKAFALSIAEEMTADDPARFTATIAKRVRNGRIFVDYLRNGRGSTAVAAFSTRARAGAPVSVPLHWDELSPEIGPAHFTVANLARRLDHLDRDPWADFDRKRRPLPGSGATRAKARRRR